MSEWHAILTVEAEEAEAARKKSAPTDKAGAGDASGGARRMIGGRKR